jgi:hypothetical protein
MKISSKLVKANQEQLLNLVNRCFEKLNLMLKEYVDYMRRDDREFMEEHFSLTDTYKSIRSYEMFEDAELLFKEFEVKIDNRIRELQDIENQIENDYNENLMKVLNEKIKNLNINKNT